MQFARESLQRHTIRQYTQDSVVIADATYAGSLAVSSEQIATDWQCASVSELTASRVDQLVAMSPEIIVIATGEHVAFPQASLLHPVMRAGIGVEVMNDGAAVRTFNVLLSEGRKAVLALIRS